METIQKAQTYKELDSQLSDWLTVAEARADEVTSQPVDLANADAIKEVTEVLSHLDADIETHKNALNRLKGKVI